MSENSACQISLHVAVLVIISAVVNDDNGGSNDCSRKFVLV